MFTASGEVCRLVGECGTVDCVQTMLLCLRFGALRLVGARRAASAERKREMRSWAMPNMRWALPNFQFRSFFDQQPQKCACIDCTVTCRSFDACCNQVCRVKVAGRQFCEFCAWNEDKPHLCIGIASAAMLSTFWRCHACELRCR